MALVQNTIGLDGHGELLRRRPLCTGSRLGHQPGHLLEVHLWETHHASSHQTDCHPNHHMSMETNLASKPHANLVDLDRRTPKVPMHLHHRAKVPPQRSTKSVTSSNSNGHHHPLQRTKCAKLDALPRNWCCFQSVSECSDVPEHLNEQLWEDDILSIRPQRNQKEQLVPPAATSAEDQPEEVMLRLQHLSLGLQLDSWEVSMADQFQEHPWC